MNCKPDSLAMIVRGLHGAENRHVGTIVHVKTLAFARTKFGPVWNIEHAQPRLGLLVTPVGGKVQGVGRFGRDGHCPDDWLRPIDDPGELAVDETLQRLQVPREEITA